MSETQVLPVAAVDVGYFSTKYSSGRDAAGKLVLGSFPSICPVVSSTSKLAAGMSALSGVVVPIGGQGYFVGPDAALRSSGREARTVHEHFARTDSYKALFRGALHYICREACKEYRDTTRVEIRRMVVGLPLNTLVDERDALREWVEGTHSVVEMPWSKNPIEVSIKCCTVIAQPQGALFSQEIREPGQIDETNCLVLDMGGGTFDWFLVHGKKAFYERCGAYPKGLLECVFAICDQIKPTLRDDLTMLQRVDTALREQRRTVRISGADVALAPLMPRVDAILKEAILRMVSSVKTLDSIDVILFTGGGARLLSEKMAEMYPELRGIIKVDANAVFANVRGFHILGEALANAR